MSTPRRFSKQELTAEIIREHRRRWLRMTAVAVLAGCVFLALMHIATPMCVSGKSMEPTLHDGQWVFVNRMDRDPGYGDIVVISRKNESWIIKRVVGLPGDEIDLLEDGTVIRNGKILQENLVCKSKEPCTMSFPLTVEEGCYFVLGDNRPHSLDSRSEELGLVNARSLIGTLIMQH